MLSSEVLMGVILVATIPIPVQAIKGAVVLDGSNFDSFVAPNKTCLCMFYATWCPHCKNFQTTYDQIAERLKGTIMVCKVDGDKSGALNNRFNIDQYPKIFLLNADNHGDPIYYQNKRDFETIVQWVLSKATVEH